MYIVQLLQKGRAWRGLNLKKRLAFSIVCTVHVREYQPIPISSVHQKQKRKQRKYKGESYASSAEFWFICFAKNIKMPAQRPARIMSSIMGKRHTHTLPRYEKHWHANCHFSACNIATKFSFANSNVASVMFCISEYLYLINLVLGTPSIILFFCWAYGNLHKFS